MTPHCCFAVSLSHSNVSRNRVLRKFGPRGGRVAVRHSAWRRGVSRPLAHQKGSPASPIANSHAATFQAHRR